MAATTAASNPIADAEQKAFAPAARVLLGALADGRSATIGELAAAAERDPDETAAILRSVPDVEWDADDRVTGLGMTLNPTPHHVEVDGHLVYAWCAADALGMLPAIGRTVRISSDCPVTRRTVTVTAGPEGVRDIQPPGAVVSPQTPTTSGAGCATWGASSLRPTQPPAGPESIPTASC
jgi:alkylmercury lyase